MRGVLVKDNGIDNVGKDAVIIRGECLVVNWDISEQDLERAVIAFKKSRTNLK